MKDVIVKSDLVDSINKYWQGSLLDGKAQLLVSECQKSTVPDICAKVIAIQTQYETGKGKKGVGITNNNLTGIKGIVGGVYIFKYYHTLDESIIDTVKVFVNYPYQDMYTIYGYDAGICMHLNKWGTKNCANIKYDINKKL